MKFEELGLSESILRAVIAEGYTTPTPIQAKAIPPVLEGRDVLGCAQTGTGKTAAFALPILQRLSQKPVEAIAATHAAPAPAPHHRTDHRSNGHVRPHAPARHIRALVLSPTRELAAQIGDSFRAYGRNTHLKHSVIFGGVNQNPQVRALRDGVDIVVATPGRLLDLMNQGFVDLKAVEVLVLDEADRMLDMGFIHDIKKIVAKLPASRSGGPGGSGVQQRQTLFFSATMPADIRHLASSILHNPVSVQVAAESATADRIEQGVYFVEKRNKNVLLTHLLNKTSFTRALVFTRTKHGADKVARHLYTAGIHAEAIHGNKSQNARQRALANFKSGKTPVLIASDIAARGIDIDEISHVINYDLPNVPETYVHRIGRTARAGASGSAISFCDHEERPYLRDIERLTRVPVPVCEDHPTYPARQPFSEQSDRRDSRPHASHPRDPHPRSEHPRNPQNAPHPRNPRTGSGHTHGPARPPQTHAPHPQAQTSPGATPPARPHQPTHTPAAAPARGAHSHAQPTTGGRPSFRSKNKPQRRW